MTTSAMDPPPPRNPNRDPEPPESNTTSISQSEESLPPAEVSSMNPPPPRNPNEPNLETTEVVELEPKLIEQSKDDSVATDADKPPRARAVKQNPVPYTIPEWSGPPCHQFQLEVLKEGAIVDQLNVHEKGAYLFGRDSICDFSLEHPSISRFHAVIQYKRSGAAYLFDLGSTHGTLINKKKVDKRVFVDLHVGAVIRFGFSSRLYIFQGPSELMPPEKDLQLIREAKMRLEMSEREASLRRARQQASMADGVSWGMGEDAIEEEEEDVEEITWQTYSGELTPKQEKTKDKVLKRLEKIGHMKKEVAAIRAKDISQGGLTQGQQTQIARNEQRTAELLEELENLEETLNDSIRESLGAKTGRKPHDKKKGTVEDEEDLSSDEDDFYDRTKKKPSTQKGSESQTVETVDSLLDKRDNVLKEIEAKNEQLSAEKNKMETENVTDVATGDSLDAYMTGLSTTLVQDKTTQIQQELSALQSELSRILYLLKIADPTGAEVKKRELKSQEPKMKKSENPPVEKKNSLPLKPADPVEHKEKEVDLMDSDKKPEVEKNASETAEEKKTTVFVPSKPQWLGSSANKATIEETKPEIVAAATDSSSTDDADGFVDYKDRKKVLTSTGIEGVTGLIIRKRKQEDKNVEEDEKSKEKQAEVLAQDAVALLLKHSVGHHVNEEDEEINKKEEDKQGSGHSRKKKKKAKKVVGPDKPEYMNESTDYDSWVPPKGQSGDGRTSLNDRLGY
ncbi:phosphatase 1 regulatory inhibitor subunit PPP1R8-like protein [Cardamine amara subsp. amara]|uniref:Phosphatase 1 regulatory inhibitor subunit PPP1R8-like protein n=1 Tax=Cardamine amara subsp. amara TaxID=228776 RepID=A0ABD0ZIN6_CARAN